MKFEILERYIDDQDRQVFSWFGTYDSRELAQSALGRIERSGEFYLVQLISRTQKELVTRVEVQNEIEFFE